MVHLSDNNLDINSEFRRLYRMHPSVQRELGNERVFTTLESLAINAGCKKIGTLLTTFPEYAVYEKRIAMKNIVVQNEQGIEPRNLSQSRVFLIGNSELITYFTSFTTPNPADVHQSIVVEERSDEERLAEEKNILLGDAKQIVDATSNVRLDLEDIRFSAFEKYPADNRYTALERTALMATVLVGGGITAGLIAEPLLQTESPHSVSSLIATVLIGATAFGATELARLYKQEQVIQRARKTLHSALHPGEGRHYNGLRVGPEALPMLLREYGAGFID